MRRGRAIVGALGLLVGVIGCGGGGSADQTVSDDVATESASIAPADDATFDNCVDEPRPELGLPAGWTTCADSGLVPPADGFGFENWGGPPTADAFTPSLAVSMFGEAAVCVDTTDGCVLHPAAQQWIDQMNLAIQGGRCEGMAVLSQRFFEGRDDVANFQPEASITAELSRDELTVGSSIARWWASQTFPAVRAATAPTLEWEPLDIAARVAQALRDGEGATIGLYGDEAAHAVTPLAVTTDSSSTVVIHVYDNNYPGQILPVDIDLASGAWSYDMAAANAGVASDVWSGGVGTMDLTLMDEREVAVPAPWSDESETKGSTVLTVSTGGASAAGLALDFAGQVLDSRDMTTKRDGVSVYPFRGARRGTGAVIVVEPRAGAFTVRPVIGDLLDSASAMVELLVTIDLPGRNSTQVGGQFEPTESDVLPSISVDVSEDEASLNIDGDGEFVVDVAYGEEGYEFELRGDVEFEFEESGDEGTFAILDEEGNAVWEEASDGEGDEGVFVETTVDYDADTGVLDESDVVIDAYELDAALLSWIVETLTEVLDEWAALLGDDFTSFFGDEFLDEFTDLLEQIPDDSTMGDDGSDSESDDPESDDPESDDPESDDPESDDPESDGTSPDMSSPDETSPDETSPDETETTLVDEGGADEPPAEEDPVEP